MSIAIFIRSVGPYDAELHGDSGKDKGWMNGDSEVRMDNLQLVNTTVLSTQDYFTSNLKVYPNPVKSTLNITSSDNAKIDSVELFSVLGKNVLATNTLINNAVDVSAIASGVYLLKVSSGTNSVTKRIVIN
ncbi:T9SS type A sorting domain-containing protein [Winogradskyella sediminis]